MRLTPQFAARGVMMTTVDVYGTYSVEADQVLTFKDEGAFLIHQIDQDMPASLIIAGTVKVVDRLDQDVVWGVQCANHQVSGSHADMWIQEGGKFSISATGQDTRVYGVSLSYKAVDFLNDGVLEVSSAAGEAQGVLVSGPLTNNGEVDVAGHGTALGMRAGVVQNNGRLDVASDGDATGIDCDHVTNWGRIAVSGSERAVGIDGGIELVNVGSLTVKGGALGSVAVYAAAYLASIDNRGQVIATCTKKVGEAVGIQITSDNSARDPIEISNQGLIRAEVALREVVGGTAALSEHIFSSGRILGDVDLGGAADIFTNAGKMHGNCLLGDGNDLYDGSRGVIHGLIDGGAGKDTLIGGKGADVLSGGADADTFGFTTAKTTNTTHADIILDLEDQDVIDLSKIDADRTHGGNQAFALVSAFDGHAGEATLSYDAGAGVTLLSLDTDGDGDADAAVRLAGEHLGFDHFVL